VFKKVTVAFALILWYKLQHFGYEKHYLESIILATDMSVVYTHSQARNQRGGSVLRVELVD